jgi:hypothetical protein
MISVEINSGPVSDDAIEASVGGLRTTGSEAGVFSTETFGAGRRDGSTAVAVTSVGCTATSSESSRLRRRFALLILHEFTMVKMYDTERDSERVELTAQCEQKPKHQKKHTTHGLASAITLVITASSMLRYF